LKCGIHRVAPNTSGDAECENFPFFWLQLWLLRTGWSKPVSTSKDIEVQHELLKNIKNSPIPSVLNTGCFIDSEASAVAALSLNWLVASTYPSEK
jgi:hypothetical protein